MSNGNNIEQKIKDGFEGVSHKAPEFLWSSIDSQLNEPSLNPIDHKVKTSFEGVKTSAPDSIWSGIDKQLTIDRGWKKTLLLLRRRTGWKWTKRVAAFSVFLFFFTPQVEYSEGKSNVASWDSSKEKAQEVLSQGLTAQVPSNKSSIHQKRASDFKKAAARVEGRDRNVEDDRIDEMSITSEGLLSQVLDTELNKGSLEQKTLYSELTTLFNKNEEGDFTNLIKRFPQLPLKHLKSLETSTIVLGMEDLKFKDESVAYNFELGVLVGLNSTALINNTTRLALRSESLVSLSPTFSSNVGVQFVYHLNERHGLVSSLTYSTIGLSSNKFIEGSYVEEDVSLSFARLQALYQFKFKRFESQRNGLNVKIGPYFAFMTSSNTELTSFSNVNQAYLESVDNLHRFNVGLSFQTGYTSEFNRFVFDYGVSFDKGLVNLNRGTDLVPAYFDRTTTMDLGVYLSIRYKL